MGRNGGVLHGYRNRDFGLLRCSMDYESLGVVDEMKKWEFHLTDEQAIVDFDRIIKAIDNSGDRRKQITNIDLLVANERGKFFVKREALQQKIWKEARGEGSSA